MRAQIQQWGQSLALKIPNTYAAETALSSGSEVEMTVEDGRLVITPGTKPRYTLEELVAGITPENRHAEIDTGPPVGNEVW
ncbi:MAG TPA: AbrB/MazE/SpoVT family DNA-binding domain-containing protein [Longimicrobium sp.]|jgi:antitoxin MazE|uniref:AbrB/MazE/SpoVT family DNA-binding domain-containing protein n=1 Tax=Longimicrobium sp. TaxID=2029185 RepID=UPI002EDAE585